MQAEWASLCIPGYLSKRNWADVLSCFFFFFFNLYLGFIWVFFPLLSWCDYSLMSFPGGSVIKNPSANAGDAGSVSGLGRFPRGGNGNPLQYSCLEKALDRGAWWAAVHGVTKSQTWPRTQTHTFISAVIWAVSFLRSSRLDHIVSAGSCCVWRPMWATLWWLVPAAVWCRWRLGQGGRQDPGRGCMASAAPRLGEMWGRCRWDSAVFLVSVHLCASQTADPASGACYMSHGLCVPRAAYTGHLP